MDGLLSFSSVISFLGCLAAGVVYAWFLYRENKNLPKRLLYILFLLRAVVISVIAWLLLVPLIKRVSYTLEKPIILIGQDNSSSIRQFEPAGFNRAAYQTDFKELAERLSKKYDVRIYHFSDSVQKGFDFSEQGKQSNASNFINIIKDEFLNRNVGAVIMASDGIFNQGENPVYDLNELKMPFYTIALGDTIPKRDALISNINYNNIIYSGNDFTIEVDVQAFQSKGESIQLRINEGDRTVHQESIALTENTFSKTVPVKLHANKAGIQKYTVLLGPLKNEITEKNNKQVFYVEVIDARQKVLIAATAPHPDITVLKQAISQNKHYEVELALADALSNADPAKYNLVILYQLPDLTGLSSAFIHQLSQAKIPVWYILGAQTDLNAFNQVQQLVQVPVANGSIREAYPEVNPDFSAFNMDESTKKQFLQSGPLLTPAGHVSYAGNGTVALRQRIGTAGAQIPLLFFMDNGGKKNGFLTGEGLWRWRLDEAESAQPFVYDLISKTVQYLSVKDDKRKFKVYSSKTAFDESEHILFNATLYNDSYEAINDPDVSLQIRNGSGKIFNYLFSKTGNAYQLDAGTLPAGNYSYTASTLWAGKKHIAQGSFFVDALIAEYQQTTANHQLLNRIAVQTGGAMFMPDKLRQLEEQLEKNDRIKTISYEDRRYEELISFKWLFVFILGLLSLEWSLRKRNGEI